MRLQSTTEAQIDMIQDMAIPKISLRPAERRDAEAIAAIYAPVVRDTVFSFETVPPSAEIMAERIEATQRRHPWLVATVGDEVTGYAYASEHRQRAAYQWSVDVTVYVAEIARGKGVGRRLYGGLLPMLRTQGFRGAFAGIALPNDASVGLHEAVGFQSLGVYKDVGFKLGAWRDVGWWRLALASGDTPPSEPMTFQQLRETSDFSSLLA
jgi:L-amino acid N-acyltransferase YncA